LSQFRNVTPEFAVSPQLGLGDVAAAKAQGFALVINNRPDGEAQDQPPGEAIEAAARVQGLDYVHIPVIGRPTADQARAVVEAAHGRKTLAFCRSGNRSIMAWALGELAAGRDGDEILRLAAAAGYDLGAALAP